MNESMALSDAERVLGLSSAYDAAEVQRAFRQLIVRDHPDHCNLSGLSYEEAEARTIRLNQAKRCVLSHLAAGNARSNTAQNEKVSDRSDAHHSPRPVEKKEQGDPSSTVSPFEFTVSDGKATPSEKGKRVLWERQLEASLFYRILAHFPYFIVILVAGWTLPFYVFGGLNIIPIWKGFIEPSGMDFLVFYALVPVAVLANFICPLHPIDWVLHKVTCGFYKGIRMAIYDAKNAAAD